MPRASTTTDVFNAIAEPRRRQIINALAGGRAHAVGELVTRLRVSQPAMSKHLGVLRKVGIVSVSRHGRRRLYRLNAGELKPHQLNRIKQQAERKASERPADEGRPAKDTPKT